MRSELQLLREGLDAAIKQLLLVLGVPKVAEGNWEEIVMAGGSLDTGQSPGLLLVRGSCCEC